MTFHSQIKNRIKGPVFSIITPFNKDEKIDFEALEKYIDRIYRDGGRTFYVMAYNSRFSQLDFNEIKALNRFVVEKVKELDTQNIVIVADPIHCSTSTSIDFCKHSESIGADLISLIFREKFYFDDQVFQHFKKCADNSQIGILIHEMPFISGLGGHVTNWPVSLLDRLADIPSVIAIKEDAKNDEYSYEVINKIKDRLNIIISGGGKRQWLQFSDIGCQSWLNGIGVFEPKLAVNFWKAKLKGDSNFYNNMIRDIEIPFFEKGVKKYGWHLTIKAALEARGIMYNYERMPLMPINNQEKESIFKLLDKLPIEDYVNYSA